MDNWNRCLSLEMQLDLGGDQRLDKGDGVFDDFQHVERAFFPLPFSSEIKKIFHQLCGGLCVSENPFGPFSLLGSFGKD